MKRILVLGAGKSSPRMISYLLEHAEENDWFITVGDLDRDLAAQRIGGHARGNAIRFNVNDNVLLETQVAQSDIVVNFLAPRFQALVAWVCVHNGTHMVSASYRSREIRELNKAAMRKGVLILNEMGLDPGIDLMSAMDIIQRVRDKGGRVRKFISYGSGLPAPDTPSNPMRYVITWNPYNVVMAGNSGAQYLEDGKIKILPYHNVFKATWPVDVEGVGTLESYANRDSLAYKEQFGLKHATTMIRATLRYPTWGEVWSKIIDLGLTNDDLTIPNLKRRSMREIVEMFLPAHVNGAGLRQRTANYLRINPTGHTMELLDWLGLFSEDKIGGEGRTAADAMMHLILKKLRLEPGGRDMVILMHNLLVDYPKEKRRQETITSTFVQYGDPDGATAMAKTVGLPAAIAVRMIATGKLPITGTQIPTHSAIYKPILAELEKMGMSFTENVEPVKK